MDPPTRNLWEDEVVRLCRRRCLEMKPRPAFLGGADEQANGAHHADPAGMGMVTAMASAVVAAMHDKLSDGRYDDE